MRNMHGFWKSQFAAIFSPSPCEYRIMRIMHSRMKLETYLKQNGISASAFARSIQVDPATVLRIKAGKVFPHRRTPQAIRDATAGQVGPNDFLDPVRPPTEPDGDRHE
jgi:hypothetical protein